MTHPSKDLSPQAQGEIEMSPLREFLMQLEDALEVPKDRIWFGAGLLEVARTKVRQVRLNAELLEALKALYQATIEAESGAILSIDQISNRRKAKLAAQAAIAKAEGSTA